MYRIVKKEQLTPNVKMLQVHAPAIAHKARPGQFVIIRASETGERIPITLAGNDPMEGTVTIYFAEVGKSSTLLGTLGVGDNILNFAGPLGNATEIKKYGRVLCVGGGVYVGALLYTMRALKEAGNEIVAVFGYRSKDHVFLDEGLKEVADEAHLCTDDGSRGLQGIDVVDELLGNQRFDLAFTIGPTSLQMNLCEKTRPYGIPTRVNLFPIMVDGMGMCGACRVTIGGDTRFSCVDGPEFDGHKVDFDELIMRMRVYNPQEKIAMVVYNRETE